jgi:hypothetical protein
MNTSPADAEEKLYSRLFEEYNRIFIKVRKWGAFEDDLYLNYILDELPVSPNRVLEFVSKISDFERELAREPSLHLDTLMCDVSLTGPSA